MAADNWTDFEAETVAADHHPPQPARDVDAVASIGRRFHGVECDRGETLDLRHDRVSITAEAQPRYQVLRRIGRGGQGVVYAVKDRDCGRVVAVKTMVGRNHDDNHVARFVHEIQITAQLEHPGVVPVHDLGVLPNGVLYYSMKRIGGRTLKRHMEELRSSGRFRLVDVLQLFLKICETMQFAHAKGVVHRDLKPGNIMIGDYGEVLIVDWGLSKVVGGTSSVSSVRHSDTHRQARQSTSFNTMAGRAVGTPGYMSPAQACG
ncbi:MAG: serine/threonine-protein kinase, partial [Planctomycetota bacterium]